MIAGLTLEYISNIETNNHRSDRGDLSKILDTETRKQCKSKNLCSEVDPLKEVNRCCYCNNTCVPRYNNKNQKTDMDTNDRHFIHCQSDIDVEGNEIYSKNNANQSRFNKNFIPITSGDRFKNFHQDMDIVNCGLPELRENQCSFDSSVKNKQIRNNVMMAQCRGYGDCYDNLKNKTRMSFIEREKCSAQMRAKYIREMEILKSRLNVLRGNSVQDGKRFRHRSDSEPGMSTVNGGLTKKVRDNYNLPKHNNLVQHRKLPSTANIYNKSRTFKRETKSMPPTLLNHKLPVLKSHSKHNRRVDLAQVMKDVSSDSEVEGVSLFGEDNMSQEDGNASEDDAQSVLSSLTSSSGSNTPSRVGETLESITLNEVAPGRKVEITNSPLVVSSNNYEQTPSPTQVNPFRNSLFSNVPPYVKFTMHDCKGPTLPLDVSRHLKWKLSTITPVVIRRTLVNSGFKLVRKSNDWTGQWGKHMKSFVFKTLKDFQKLNHFPGTFQIGRKDRLWKNLYRLMLKFGKKEFGFIPRTYILPQDNKSLRAAWEKSLGKGQWIVKPPAAARGTGIHVVHKWSQIPKKRPLIVQKYIAQPYLINGSKFDLRLYVLMTSVHPLCLYVYDDGLVRFASVKYSGEATTLSDRFMHLTNYSINKLSNQYCANEDATACLGHKWTLKSLWTYMEKHDVDVKELKRNLVDLIIKTIISGESSITQMTKNNLTSRYCSYELFGIDVLLDENLKPWLLEVNISPSLHSASPLDLAVKGPMVRDLLNVAGFQIPSKLLQEQQDVLLETYGLKDKTSSLCLDKRMYSMCLSKVERMKQASHQMSTRQEYMSTILQDLTPDDVRHLIQFEDELTQLGRFEKVFPTCDTHTYHHYFETPRYYNMMFDAWETKYSNKRWEGIKVLEALCQQKIHLIVPFPGGRAKYSVSQSSLNSSTPTVQSLEHQEVEELESDLSEDGADGDDDEEVDNTLQTDNNTLNANSIILKVAKHARKYNAKSTFPTCRKPKLNMTPRLLPHNVVECCQNSN